MSEVLSPAASDTIAEAVLQAADQDTISRLSVELKGAKSIVTVLIYPADKPANEIIAMMTEH